MTRSTVVTTVVIVAGLSLALVISVLLGSPDYLRQIADISRFLCSSPSQEEVVSKYGPNIRMFDGTDSLVMEGWTLPPWKSKSRILVFDQKTFRVYVEIIEERVYRFWIGTS